MGEQFFERKHQLDEIEVSKTVSIVSLIILRFLNVDNMIRFVCCECAAPQEAARHLQGVRASSWHDPCLAVRPMDVLSPSRAEPSRAEPSRTEPSAPILSHFLPSYRHYIFLRRHR